jgi:hypothetical protein
MGVLGPGTSDMLPPWQQLQLAAAAAADADGITPTTLSVCWLTHCLDSQTSLTHCQDSQTNCLKDLTVRPATNQSSGVYPSVLCCCFRDAASW